MLTDPFVCVCKHFLRRPDLLKLHKQWLEFSLFFGCKIMSCVQSFVFVKWIRKNCNGNYILHGYLWVGTCNRIARDKLPTILTIDNHSHICSETCRPMIHFPLLLSHFMWGRNNNLDSHTRSWIIQLSACTFKNMENHNVLPVYGDQTKVKAVFSIYKKNAVDTFFMWWGDHEIVPKTLWWWCNIRRQCTCSNPFGMQRFQAQDLISTWFCLNMNLLQQAHFWLSTRSEYAIVRCILRHLLITRVDHRHRYCSVLWGSFLIWVWPLTLQAFCSVYQFKNVLQRL